MKVQAISRRQFKLTLTAALLGSVLPVQAVLAKEAAQPGKEDAVRMVDKVIAAHKAQGRDKTLAEVNLKDGPFVKGELYVFAFDPLGNVLAHPFNPKLIGKNTLELPDPDGKYFRKTIMEVANTKGVGWVDYKYKNPETGHLEAKTSYFRKEGEVIYVCGVYL